MSLARTTGLALEVDETLRSAVTLGWLEAATASWPELPEGWIAERDEVSERIRTRFAGKSAGDIPGVGENRSMFHRLGVDPTKTRPSSEALLRRVLKGQALPVIHPAVDICNLASVEHQFALGLYDRDKLSGPVFARLGRLNEGYPGIRKGHVNLAGRPLLADDEGPFGAPTSDSARTQVGAKTRSLLVVVYRPVERPSADLSSMLGRVADLLGRWCAATVSVVRTVQ